MLTIEVELLHGTIRAQAEDMAMTGQEDPGEWPPSPARLFSAFVAADGTRGRCKVTDGTELQVLEAQAPPVIYADAPAAAPEITGEPDLVPASPVIDRFVVINDTEKNTVQNYPARKAVAARPGTRRAPKNPHVAYVWPDVDLDPASLGALQRRAARIGYLGCADSPVRVRVSDTEPSNEARGSGPDAQARRWEPSDQGTERLPVPFIGITDVLDAAYDEFMAGNPVRRSWYRTQRARYRSPNDRPEVAHDVPGIFIWLRFGQALPGGQVVMVTTRLRKAILANYQAIVGEGADLPAVLTGHGFSGTGYDHLALLALPDARVPTVIRQALHGGEPKEPADDPAWRARGRIHGAAIWMPDSTPGDVVSNVHAAVRQLSRRGLRWPELPGGDAVAVSFHDGERRPWAAHPRRWQLPASIFVSAFPVVHERFCRPEPDLAEVARWCEHAGLPTPKRVWFQREPQVPGGASLRPGQVFRGKDDRRPYSHMGLVFDRLLKGPVVLGRKRTAGLGLFLPVLPPDDEGEKGEDADG